MTDYANKSALIRASELSNMSDDAIDGLIKKKGYAWTVGVLQERLPAVHSVATIALKDEDE